MSFPLFDAPLSEHSAKSAFSANPLNRLSENRSETCIEDAMKDPRSRYIVVAFGKMILRKIGESLSGVFGIDDLKPFSAHDGTIVLLGWDKDGVPWLAAQSSLTEDDIPDDLVALDFRSIYIQGLVEPELLGALAQAGALLAWHKSHAFCSRCGFASELQDGGYKRVCPNCGMQHFPRTDPVVIMLTISKDGEKCLLGRSPHFAEGVYSCLAGFVEPGETIEAAMRRETKEESGINVGRVVYHASQPWPFPYSLMIGCYGEAENEKIVLDDELEDARWFSRKEVQSMVDGDHPESLKMPPMGAIANNLVMFWLDGS